MSSFRSQADAADPLYLDGNPLGRLPEATATRMREVVEAQWGGRLIRGWGEGWIEMPRRIGAETGEVVAPDSTSVTSSSSPTRRASATDRRVVVRIARTLVAEKDVVPDLRTPDVLRLGAAPLYTRYVDLAEAMARIVSVVERDSFKAYTTSMAGVT